MPWRITISKFIKVYLLSNNHKYPKEAAGSPKPYADHS